MADPRSVQADALVLRPPAFPRDAFAYCIPLTEVVTDVKKPDVAIVDTLLEPLELNEPPNGQLHGVPLPLVRSWHILPLFEDEGFKYPTGWLPYSVRCCSRTSAGRTGVDRFSWGHFGLCQRLDLVSGGGDVVLNRQPLSKAIGSRRAWPSPLARGG